MTFSSSRIINFPRGSGPILYSNDRPSKAKIVPDMISLLEGIQKQIKEKLGIHENSEK